MIALIEALNFRCLRYVRQPLEAFHVLVGPNASGKTTFLDVVAFLGHLVSEGPEAAVRARTQNIQDLIWERTGDRFELAIEARIPDTLRSYLATEDIDTIRYEVAIGNEPATEEIAILAEKVLLKGSQPELPGQRAFFPNLTERPDSILTTKKHGTHTIINKIQDGNDNFYSEVTSGSGKGWFPAFKFGPRKSALANLPADETKFPVSSWLKTFLIEGSQQIQLNSLLIRKASPPGQFRGFKPDGSNLPWVIEDLKNKSPERFHDWIGHLRTALPDLVNIRTVIQPDDRHRYLMLQYQGGLEVPSWVASDGTLRLLALTLIAYLTDFTGVYLIEEPENGIHPTAVETMYQSLSSVYDGQILLATHSPVILSNARANQVLCFAKTPEGATDIVLGSNHPALQNWQGETNLSLLFAAGVLG
jgi:ABC-type transport system involved in cytochrome c biogenesis ATPase subunit